MHTHTSSVLSLGMVSQKTRGMPLGLPLEMNRPAPNPLDKTYPVAAPPLNQGVAGLATTVLVIASFVIYWCIMR